MTGQLLHTAGITVTAVTVTDLGPGVTATRIDVAVPGGTRQVTTRLADGPSPRRHHRRAAGRRRPGDGPARRTRHRPRPAQPVPQPPAGSPRAAPGPPPRPQFEPSNLAFDRTGLVLRVTSQGRSTPQQPTGQDPRHDPANHFAFATEPATGPGMRSQPRSRPTPITSPSASS
jgi:hypothetical protein